MCLGLRELLRKNLTLETPLFVMRRVIDLFPDVGMSGALSPSGLTGQPLSRRQRKSVRFPQRRGALHSLRSIARRLACRSVQVVCEVFRLGILGDPSAAPSQPSVRPSFPPPPPRFAPQIASSPRNRPLLLRRPVLPTDSPVLRSLSREKVRQAPRPRAVLCAVAAAGLALLAARASDYVFLSWIPLAP